MIIFETLPINTVFYGVVRVNHSWQRQRLEFTDSNGVTWHRYNLPEWSVEVRSYQLVARMRKIVEGEWLNDTANETEYLAKYSNGKTEYFYPDSNDGQYFLHREDATAAAEHMRTELEK